MTRNETSLDIDPRPDHNCGRVYKDSRSSTPRSRYIMLALCDPTPTHYVHGFGVQPIAIPQTTRY